MVVGGNKVEVIVEEAVRDEFIHDDVEEDSYVGLLIGAYTESGVYCVAHKAPTLEEDSEENSDANSNSSPSKSSSPKHGDGSGSGPAPVTVLNLTPQLISRHAKQVIRMLPGGLQILGLYIIEKTDNLFTQKYEPSLKSLYVHLNKGLSRNPFYGSEFGCEKNEKLIFHFNPQTKKFNCKIMIDGSVLSTKSVETSFGTVDWAKLECEYDTTAALHLSKNDLGLPLKKNLNILLKSFQESLSTARFFIEGKIPSPDIPFEEPQGQDENGSPTNSSSNNDDMINVKDLDLDAEILGGGVRIGRAGDGPDGQEQSHGSSDNDFDITQHHKRPVSPVHILVEKVPATLIKKEEGSDFLNHLHMRGKIAAVAFVRDGDSTQQIVQMLKQDILRSMASRFEMHCESLIDEDANGSSGTDVDGECTKVYHEVPRRVFVNLPKSRLVVSDYLFPGEGAKDSFDSFRDLLNLDIVNEDDVITFKEKPFDLDDVEIKGSMEELLSKAESMSKLPPGLITSRKAFTLILVLSLVIGLLALIIPAYKK